MTRPYREELPDPREIIGDWVIDGAGRGARKIGEAASIAVARHTQTDEEIVLISVGEEVTSIPVTTLRRILG